MDKKIKQMFIIPILLCMTGIFSCENQIPNSEIKQPDPNVHFSDNERQTKLIHLLDQNNIPYRIEKYDNAGNNFVVWSSKYNKKVSKLMETIYAEDGDQPPSNISFPTQEQNEYFIFLLGKESIPYEIDNKMFNGKKMTNIQYKTEDVDKIRNLKIKVLREKPLNP